MLMGSIYFDTFSELEKYALLKSKQIPAILSSLFHCQLAIKRFIFLLVFLRESYLTLIVYYHKFKLRPKWA